MGLSSSKKLEPNYSARCETNNNQIVSKLPKNIPNLTLFINYVKHYQDDIIY